MNKGSSKAGDAKFWKQRIHLSLLDDSASNIRGEPQLLNACKRFRPYSDFLRISLNILNSQAKVGFRWKRARTPQILTLGKDWSLHSIAKPGLEWEIDIGEAIPEDNESIELVYRDDEGSKVLKEVRRYSIQDGLVVTAEDLSELTARDITYLKRPVVIRKRMATRFPAEWRTQGGEPIECRIANGLGPEGAWNFLVRGDKHHANLTAGGTTWRATTMPRPSSWKFRVGRESVIFENGEYTLEDGAQHQSATCEVSGCEFSLTSRPVTSGFRSKGGVAVELMAEDGGEDTTVDAVRQLMESDTFELSTRSNSGRWFNFTILERRKDSGLFLLKEAPPEGAVLTPRIHRRQLYLQQRAIYQLTHAPLPHQLPLLRLGDRATDTGPNSAGKLPVHSPVGDAIPWTWLKHEGYEGTGEQREFVQKALATDDFAVMQGPPGSGKTTAICELIARLCAEGRSRILLCGNTHAAVDNVIDKLKGDKKLEIDILRLGRDRGDSTTSFDQRRKALESKGIEPDEAIDLVTRMADVTCCTVEGLSMHPALGAADKEEFKDNKWSEPICVLPFWDVMILDEASKTLFHQFLLPAMLAKRWIVVGDPRQLPPFADETGLKRNIRNCHLMPHSKDEEIVDRDQPWQQASMIRNALYRHVADNRSATPLRDQRMTVVLPGDTARELYQQLVQDGSSDCGFVHPSCGRVAPAKGWLEITPEKLDDESTRLRMAMCELLIVDESLWDSVADKLPAVNHVIWPDEDSSRSKDPTAMRERFRQNALTARMRTEGAVKAMSEDASRHFSEELSWRLNRLNQLKDGTGGGGLTATRNRLQGEIETLIPPDRHKEYQQIQQAAAVAIPSVLDALLEGQPRSRASGEPTLMDVGLVKDDGDDRRFVRLSYQHRMHPSLSQLPREAVYDNKMLRDAKTVLDATTREPSADSRKTGWKYRFPELASRRLAWIETGKRKFGGGVNRQEADAMMREVKAFTSWATSPGNRKGNGTPWEIALLSFYVPQVKRLKELLQSQLSNYWNEDLGAYATPSWTLRFNTVDSFQGWEADLVLLSMRNIDRVGFMDSPNRLNVGITRARELLIVFGHREFYQTAKKYGEKCQFLNQLAAQAHPIS